MMAVKGCAFNYKLLSEHLKARKDFQIATFASGYNPFIVLPKELEHDFEFLVEAIKTNGRSIIFISDKDLKERIEKELGYEKNIIYVILAIYPFN